MNPRFLLPVMSALLLQLALPERAVPADQRKGNANRVMVFNNYSSFLANNVFNYYGNNGGGSFNPHSSDDEGFEYPIGSGKHTIFEDGVVWGGFVNGGLRVGGSTYLHGIQAGKILPNGQPDDGNQTKYRVYRVRPDIKGGTNPTPFSDVEGVINSTEIPFLVRYESETTQSIYNQYVTDWNEWPANEGAPFVDVNHDGIYEPDVDIPGKPGADQTLWYVGNDLNPGLVSSLCGSVPIGLEMQKTIWGYRQKGPLGNTIFASTILINRSGAPIDSMFIMQWSDPDVGYGFDDFVGCDTLQNLAFAYNGSSSDPIYGFAVPAVGQMLVQGPIVHGSPTDTAVFGGVSRAGFKNLPMTTFDFSSQGIAAYADPPIGPGGDMGWYRLMNGRIAASGEPFIDPNTAQPTKFCLSGDPVTVTGWCDGQGGLIPQDRRMCLVSGPFSMAAGDTQEIVVATFVAQGADRLASVALLKSYAANVRAFLRKIVVAEIAPVDSLYPTHETINLYGSAATRSLAQPTLHWFVQSRPSGSAAVLQNADSPLARINPDTPGVYRIGLAASVPDAAPDTAMVDLAVTSVQRPVAAFSLSSTVTLGDTVTMDASASYDPNGFPLMRTWEVVGSKGGDFNTPRDTMSGYLSSATATKVSFVPLRTSLHTVQLSVRNSTFTTTLDKTFQVTPLASPNVTLRAQFGSGSLPYLTAPGFGWSGLYGWGGIKDIDGMIWVNDAGTCAQVNFGDYSHPSQVYNMDGFPFDGGQNYLAAGYGNQVTVIKTDGAGAILSGGEFLVFVPPVYGDTSVANVIFRNPYILLPCRKPGIIVYNIANPSAAERFAQYYDGESWASTVADGTLLYGVHPVTKRVSIVDISNPGAIAPVHTIQLNNSYGSIAKVGQYFYLINSNPSAGFGAGNADTIAIYDFSNPAVPLLKGTIAVPKTLNPNNRFVHVAGNGAIVMTSTAEGIYLFDVSNPSNPIVAGSYLTGTLFSSVFMNDSRMLAVNYNRSGDFPGPHEYEGLLDLVTPFTSVGEDREAGIPSTVSLDQNYPNPFNPSTVIRYGLVARSEVTLEVYNTLGQKVRTLVRQAEDAGYHEAKFDGSGLASGVYFYRIQAGSFVQTRKLLLLR